MIYEVSHITNYVRNYFDDHINVDLSVSQTGKQVDYITGSVFQSGTQTPLANAIVRIVGRNRQTKTDENGKFSFIFRVKGTCTLQVILEGYKTYTLNPINITSSSQINLYIELELTVL
jgi:hypothetical protein